MKNQDIQDKLVDFIRRNTEYHSLYWFPLNKIRTPISVAAYNIDKIYKDNKVYLLERVFSDCSIKDVDTFQMDYLEYFEADQISKLLYEKDIDGYCFPWYVETFYFDKTKEWLVYVSHEGTITFTGDKIVRAANMIIPEKYKF